ncbi:MAG: iron-sulfur cluster-binding domain-containing protein, partial [Archangium sp.]|nr:iron-sulfur cluster-binding domain-containing protein [Archangium sp.]
LDFQPGQFVLVRPNASLPWRAYSFSRAPGQPLRLTVKKVEGGKVSTHLTTTLAAGDRLEVKGPYGQFLIPAIVTRGLFIAGGSGITPFLSWLSALDARAWPFPVTLIVGNRNAQEQILKAELDAFEKKSNGKLTCVHVTDDVQGPLTKELLGTLLAKVDAPSFVAMCGPEPMMNNAKEVALAKFPGVTVLEEKFSASADSIGDGPTEQLELMQDGKVKPFEVKPGEHVLAAARRAGFDLPSGCEMGACGACRVKLIDGDIGIPDDACLSDSEKSQGYRLICVGKAKGKARFESAP